MKIALIDLFCGAGGTTTGVERAKMFGKKVAKVIACVNHDTMAIKSHRSNHKGVLHFTEDIRTLNLDRLLKLVKKYRDQGYIIALWASLECTNFSLAKGGLPRDADSRTLAEHLIRYIMEICPEYVFIENVMEFMSWGPLNEKGKPVSRDKGKDYIRWVDEIKSYGYNHDWRKIDSADFGAHTSRKRYFGVFAKGNMPISFPKATHTKNPEKVNNLFSEPLKKWKPVKEVLDLQDEGNSIFNRKKPLTEKTLKRIHAGLLKYVAGGDDTFIQKYYSGNQNIKVKDVESPAGTITTVDHHSIVKCNFILKYNSTSKEGKHVPPSIEEPCPVVACQNRLGIVNAEFMMKYYGKGSNFYSIDNTCGTLTTKDRIAKVHISKGQNDSVNEPAGSLTTVPKLSIVTAKPFLMPTHFGNGPKSIEDPAPVITANRKHTYLVNPSWFGNPGDINNPCPTIVARQDKAPLYFVMAEQTQSELAIPVFDSDSETMVKIKEFMVLYNIVDIKMRMLKVPELLKIQGFPKNYILQGNQAQQKKFIGNSVVPLVAEVLIKETYRALSEYFEKLEAA